MTQEIKIPSGLTVEEISAELTPLIYNSIIQKMYSDGELPDLLTLHTRYTAPDGFDYYYKHSANLTKYHNQLDVDNVDFTVVNLPMLAISHATAEELAESFKKAEAAGSSSNPDGCVACGDTDCNTKNNTKSDNNKQQVRGIPPNSEMVSTAEAITKTVISNPNTTKGGANKFAEDRSVGTITEVGVRPAKMTGVRTGYQSLATVLALALEQAQNGKGNARHQVGDAQFTEQPICELARMYGVGYNFGQAAKKAHETQQLTSNKAKLAEILGAINYLAAAYIIIDEQDSRDY